MSILTRNTEYTFSVQLTSPIMIKLKPSNTLLFMLEFIFDSCQHSGQNIIQNINLPHQLIFLWFLCLFTQNMNSNSELSIPQKQYITDFEPKHKTNRYESTLKQIMSRVTYSMSNHMKNMKYSEFFSGFNRFCLKCRIRNAHEQNL